MEYTFVGPGNDLCVDLRWSRAGIGGCDGICLALFDTVCAVTGIFSAFSLSLGHSHYPSSSEE